MQDSANLNNISPQPYGFTLHELASSPKHWHVEIEGVYVENGWVTIEVDEKKYHLEATNFIFIPKGVVHAYVEKSEICNIYVFKFLAEHISPHVFSNLIQTQILALYQNCFIARSLPPMYQIINQLQLFNFEKYSSCFFIGKLIELTTYFLAFPALITTNQKCRHVDNSDHLQSTFDFIHDHLLDGITLSDLASYLGFNVSYCSHYIKQNTGLCFVEHVNNMKVSEAEFLLLNTDKTIAEIAFASGFSSIQTFNRVFKQIRNISPREYRSLNKLL